jgi:5-methylcytosine-specific restriction endonuclease McrA
MKKSKDVKRPEHAWYKLTRWTDKRARQLAAFPLCKHCQERGRVTAANVADHVEPHDYNPHKFWYGELQSLCDSCHSQWKQSLEALGYSNELGADGMPIDRNHPFYR